MDPEKEILNEKDLEIKAATDPVARDELRNAVRATVLNQVVRISALRSIEDNREDELVEIGMSAFDEAFNVYLKNGKVHDGEINFSPYFAWWARQAIAKHLGE